MKSYGHLFLLLVILVPSVHLNGADTALSLSCRGKVLLNDDWFYGDSPYYDANRICEAGKWKEAPRLYEAIRNRNDSLYTQDNVLRFIHDRAPEKMEYDKQMGLLNQAMCSIAQGEKSPHLTSVDLLVSIPEEKQISKHMINSGVLKGKSVLVRTDEISMKDLFYFIGTVHQLQERAGCFIQLLVSPHLKSLLSSFAKAFRFDLLEEGGQSYTRHRGQGYMVHIISLAGHLELRPDQLGRKKIIANVNECIHSFIKRTIACTKHCKNMAIVMVANDAPITLIGGRKLDSSAGTVHSKVWNKLLKDNRDLAVVSYGKPDSIIFDKDHNNRAICLRESQKSFDILIALAYYMSLNQNVIALCDDTDDAAVFVSCLNPKVQKRMAFIVPDKCNPYKEGEGLEYKDPTSKCRIYKYASSDDYIAVIQKAYKNTIMQCLPDNCEQQFGGLEELSDDYMTIE